MPDLLVFVKAPKEKLGLYFQEHCVSYLNKGVFFFRFKAISLFGRCQKYQVSMTFRLPEFLFILSLCLLLTAPSSPAGAESLSAAVTEALRHHPSVDAAATGVDIAHEKKREEFSGYFPELSVTGTAGRIYGDNSTSRGLSVTRGAAYSPLGEGSITFRQMLFDGLETKSRIEAAGARKRSAGSNVSDVRESIALRAAQAYAQVLRSRRGLGMLYKHRKKVGAYLNRIESMVNEGAADEAELQQDRDIRVILEGIIADFEGQVRAFEADYVEATGHMPGADMDRPVPRLDFIPAASDEAVIYAQSYHPALLSAQMDSVALEHDIDAEKAILFPDLDGELSYLKSDKDDIIGGEIVDAKAVFRLNWSFSTGGAELARIRRKKLEHEEAKAQAREIQRQIEREIRLAYSEQKTAVHQYDLLKKRMALNEKLFETYEAQFEGARISQLQLMQADNQLFNTRLERMNGEYRLLAAQYATLASIGRLQESLSIVPDVKPKIPPKITPPAPNEHD